MQQLIELQPSNDSCYSHAGLNIIIFNMKFYYVTATNVLDDYVDIPLDSSLEKL